MFQRQAREERRFDSVRPNIGSYSTMIQMYNTNVISDASVAPKAVMDSHLLQCFLSYHDVV